MNLEKQGFRTLESKSQFMRADVQGLRAIAIISVLAYHANLPIQGGFVGVDIFFVISGFVISGQLMRMYEQFGKLNLRGFFERRLKRLYPVLQSVVITTLFLTIFLLSPFGPQQQAAGTAFYSVFFSANVFLKKVNYDYFAPNTNSNPLIHLWSLSVEWRFYFFLPIFIYLIWNTTFKRKIYATLLVAAGSLSLALLVQGDIHFESLQRFTGFYVASTRAWEFMAGVLISIIKSPPPPQLCRLFSWIGSTLIFISVFRISDVVPFPGGWTLLPVVGTSLLILAGKNSRPLSTKILSSRFLKLIGDRSYSYYLWHWPFIVFANIIWPFSSNSTLLATLVSLIPAEITYRRLEKPYMRRNLDKGFTKFVIQTSAVSAILSTLVFLGANKSWFIDWPTPPQEKRVAAQNCTDKLFDEKICKFGPTLNSGSVLLLGDSQAYSIAEGVIAAASRNSLITYVSAKSACPFIASGWRYPKSSDCNLWQEQMFNYAFKLKPKIVIIANRSPGYVNNSWKWFGLNSSKNGEKTRTALESEQSYRKALNEVSLPLNNYGIPILIINSIPDINLGVEDLRNANLARDILQIWNSRAYQATRSEAEKARFFALMAETEVAKKALKTFNFDPIQVLCNSQICPKKIGLRSLYIDYSHLSIDGAMFLVPQLQEKIKEILEEQN